MFHATFASADQKEGMAAFSVRLLNPSSESFHFNTPYRRNVPLSSPINELRRRHPSARDDFKAMVPTVYKLLLILRALPLIEFRCQTIEMLALQKATLSEYFSLDKGTPLPPSSMPRLLRIL
jgi:hypothetical protein